MAISRRSSQDNIQLLIFSSEELPASHSVSPDSVADWETTAVIWPSNIFNWLKDCAPAGWYGRTSPEYCLVVEDGTLVPLSGRWRNAGMGGPTESLTLSISEFHSGAVESTLSDILETGDVPQRYFLSAKACAGILRRAAKRGKKLPPQLAHALREVADSGRILIATGD